MSDDGSPATAQRLLPWVGAPVSLAAGARILGLATVVLALVSAVAPAADAAPGPASPGSAVRAGAGSGAWMIQHTPDPPVSHGQLSGDSCSSPTACIAVGNYVNRSSVQVILAEAWDGSSWSIQTARTPSGATTSTLNSVSCASASACTAVGSSENSSGVEVTLAERWDGTSWSIQQTPALPGDGNGLFNGVSCTSASSCTAVGSYFGSGSASTLAEVWDGTSWSIQKTPNPPRFSLNNLVGVSCISASACTAVGNMGNSAAGAHTLAEVWDGTSWSIKPTPKVKRSDGASLDGVSCSSASSCTAVGTSGVHALAERWDGTSWSTQQIPRNVGAKLLSSVSCSSASACTAVGSASAGKTLAEAWDGTSWSVQPTPSSAGGSLNGVSCPSPGSCTAVGSASDVALAEAWDGTSWSIQKAPTPAGVTISSTLRGVSCTSASSCFAVGDYDNSLNISVTLTERWNGTSWSIQKTPSPKSIPGGLASTLNGVSCTSASSCTAVGYSSAGERTLAERWNGTSWSIQKIPTPAGGLASILTGVSCTSRSACTAVGYEETGLSSQVALAEAWDGTSWSIQKPPTPSGGGVPTLNGVSCTSASACTAVGDYVNSSSTQVPLAEVWDGTSWSIQPTPPPAGVPPAALAGVSCASASACTAIGSTDEATLAERWDGTSWSIQPTPSPKKIIFFQSLGGVSCASASACTVVWTTGFRTVAEVWDGTSWSIQQIPRPKGSFRHVLYGVSCVSVGACTAVGDYDKGSPDSFLRVAGSWATRR